MTADLTTWLRERYRARQEQLEFVRDFIPENHQGEFVDVEQELRELDAKRRILDLHRPVRKRSTGSGGGIIEDCQMCDHFPAQYPCATMRLLALPLADHPDYREEWRS